MPDVEPKAICRGRRARATSSAVAGARLGRRQALWAAATLLAAPGPARADAGPVRVRIHTLELEGRPLGEGPWLDAQWAEVSRLFGEAGVALERLPVRTTAVGRPDVVSRADRDAFAAGLEPGVVNVFVIGSLADVDEPGRMRKGVHWRPSGRADLHYVLLIGSSPRGVLAHELGHFFGLAHSGVRDNLMSYARSEGGTLFLDRGQRARVLASARASVASGELGPGH